MSAISPEILFRLDLVRHEIWRLLGAMPKRCDLQLELIESTQKSGVIIEKVRYQIEADQWVESYVGRPITIDRPLPGIVALHQHGGNRFCGKGEIFDTTGPELRRGIHGWGFELVKRGYVVIAPDQCTMEDRRWSTLENSGDPSQETFETTARLALGSSYMAKLAFDSMRAVDVLQARDDVDPARIGAIGTSGGGSQTFTLGLVDARVTAMVISSGIASIGSHIRGAAAGGGMTLVPHWLEVGDKAAGIAAMAPRAALIGSGSEDYLFPTDGVYNTYFRGKQAYDQLECPDRLHLHLFPGTHLFTPDLRQYYYDWLDRHLKHQPIDHAEIWYMQANPIDATHYQAPRCAGPYRTQRMDQDPIVVRRIETKQLDIEQVRIIVDDTPVNPNRREVLEPYDEPSDYMRQMRSLVLEMPGLDLSIAMSSESSGDAGKRPATIVLHRSVPPFMIGCDETTGLAGDERFAIAPALAAKDHVVASVELIGHGNRRNSKLLRRWPRGTDIQWMSPMMSFFETGTTMMARALYEVDCVIDYLAARNDVDENRVSVIGYGAGGLIALLAAAHQPRLAAAACVGGLTTIKAAIEQKTVNNPWIYRPDVHLTGDVDDEAAAMAPRPLQLVLYEQDVTAPPQGAQAIASALKKRFNEAERGDDLVVQQQSGSLDENPPPPDQLAQWIAQATAAD